MKGYAVYSIASMLPVLLSAGFLLLVLFGVFENRKQNEYVFRFRLFTTVIAGIFVANMLLVIPVISGSKDMILSASKYAEIAIEKNRAVQKNIFTNLGLMFPEILNDETKQCYQAALSNYVEDQWDKSFNSGIRERDPAFCDKNPSVCNGKQEDYYESIRDIFNPSHILFRDFGVLQYSFSSPWIAAAVSSKSMRRLFRQPDDKGNMPEPPDEQMLANYRQYLTNCSSLKPLPWATPDGPLLKSGPIFCVGRCL